MFSMVDRPAPDMCPFCGSHDLAGLHFIHNGRQADQIQCRGCLATGPEAMEEGGDAAILAWNRRIKPQ